MPELPEAERSPREAKLEAELARLNKMVTALMNRAEQITPTLRAECRCGEVRRTISGVRLGALTGFPFPIHLLGDAEVLHQRNMRRAHVTAATAFKTIHQMKIRFHFFVTFLARQHAHS